MCRQKSCSVRAMQCENRISRARTQSIAGAEATGQRVRAHAVERFLLGVDETEVLVRLCTPFDKRNAGHSTSRLRDNSGLVDSLAKFAALAVIELLHHLA